MGGRLNLDESPSSEPRRHAHLNGDDEETPARVASRVRRGQAFIHRGLSYDREPPLTEPHDGART